MILNRILSPVWRRYYGDNKTVLDLVDLVLATFWPYGVS